MRILVSILLLACCSNIDGFGMQRASKYTGEKLAHLLSTFSGMTVSLEPDKPEYTLGETVTVHYRVQCQQPRVEPFSSSAILGGTMLFMNGQPVKKLFSPSPGQSSEVGSEFEGSIYLGSAFWSENSRNSFGFELLEPGDYVGYFDAGIVSPDFEFRILPVPDRLEYLWTSFQELSALSKDYTLTPSLSLMDEVIALTTPLIERPANSIWRKEALGCAIGILGRHRGIWRESDREFVLQLLQKIPEEDLLSSSYLFVSIKNTLYRDRSLSEASSGVAEFVERMNKPELLDDARAWIRKNSQNSGEER